MDSRSRRQGDWGRGERERRGGRKDCRDGWYLRVEQWAGNSWYWTWSSERVGPCQAAWLNRLSRAECEGEPRQQWWGGARQQHWRIVGTIVRQRRQLKPGSGVPVQAPAYCAPALPRGSSPRLRYGSGPLTPRLTLKQPLLTFEARRGRGKKVSWSCLERYLARIFLA